MKYQPIIGLEVHVELKTKSKMFCGCSADYFGHEPNTHVCPVCLGLPGALPVPNKQAIEWCLMIGLALNCEIPLSAKFDRKNYFYPDLAKGYQISQYDKPFCKNGHVILSGTKDPAGNKRDSSATPQNDIGKQIRIRRVHMEEDTAKLIHQFGTQNYSLIDFNRSGVPLVEIVTEPDFESAQEVLEYLKKLQQSVRYLEVSNADMERGEMRLEPNISLKECHSERSEESRSFGLRPQDDIPGYKVEVKNINSFRFVERAINYELERQKKLLEEGETPRQETRGWDEQKQATLPQRGKEEAHDYRYFPEPDIPPIKLTKYQISNIKYQISELPETKFDRFKKEYGLPDYDLEILTREKETADYFEEAARVASDVSSIKYPAKGEARQGRQVASKTIANWIINKKVDIAKTLPAELVQTIISQSQTVTFDEEELEKIIKQVLLDNPKAVSDYRMGKTQVLEFLTGKVKQLLKQPVDALQIRISIEEVIKKYE